MPRARLSILILLLVLGCHGGPAPLAGNDSSGDEAIEEDAVDPDTAARAAKIRAWHARLPEKWRAPLEGHLDPERVAVLVSLVDSLPELPHIEVEPLVPGLPIGEDWLDENESEADTLGRGTLDAVYLAIDPTGSTFRPTTLGQEQLSAWAAKARPILMRTKDPLRDLIAAPLVPAAPGELGEISPAEFDVFGVVRKLSHALNLCATVERFDAKGPSERAMGIGEFVEISDSLLVLCQRQPRTLLQGMFLRVLHVRRIPLVRTALPFVETERLREWSRVSPDDPAAEYLAMMRGEFSRAFLSGLAKQGEEEFPGLAAFGVGLDEPFDRLLEDHPDRFDPVVCIDRCIEVAQTCHERLLRGEDLAFPPPIWLDAVLAVWPEETEISPWMLTLPSWEAWEPRGTGSIEEAAGRLAGIRHAEASLLAGVPAALGQTLIDRLRRDEIFAHNLTVAAACACVLHERTVGLFPRTWEEVVASGALAEIPIDPCSPDGAPLTLDPELRSVRSVGQDGSAGPLPPPLESLDGEWFLPDGTPVEPESGISTDDIVIEVPRLR